MQGITIHEACSKGPGGEGCREGTPPTCCLLACARSASTLLRSALQAVVVFLLLRARPALCSISIIYEARLCLIQPH